MPAQHYFESYERNGFNFTKKVLTKYCLSLYTKPFVILSGISGTGKTKIAQLFTTFESLEIPEVQPIIPEGVDYIIINVTNSLINGDGRANLRFKDLNSVFEDADIPALQERINIMKARGGHGNITDGEGFTIEAPDHTELPIKVYLQRAASPLVRVRFISKEKEVPRYNSQEYIRRNYNVGDVLKLQKIGPKRLKIIAVNDREVIEVNETLEAREIQEIPNKLFISVRSNWNDNSELFGYYNILDEKYYVTPFLNFILTAKEYHTKLFFLVLDEMNLSRVEYYFSDYLSCLESRMMVDGNMKQEHVYLHNQPLFAESNDDYFDAIPNKIEIPNNLYVTGTVNIDETTHSFSPKVLDRANVIEFNEVNVLAYDGAEPSSFILRQFPTFQNAAIASSTDYNSAPEQFKTVVQDLLTVLQPYNLHFGYRVINEMALFINNAVQFIERNDRTIDDAIDVQISQKILPKFNGAFGKLDEPLRKLIQYMVLPQAVEAETIDLAFIDSIDFNNQKFPESLSKICRLYKNLVFNGFASFLE